MLPVPRATIVPSLCRPSFMASDRLVTAGADSLAHLAKPRGAQFATCAEDSLNQALAVHSKIT